jgi:hypothetical protein
VLTVEPPTTIKYSLFSPRPDLEDVPENYFTMTYSLKEQDRKTELTITQEDPREQPEGQTDGEGEASPILTGRKQLVEGSKH